MQYLYFMHFNNVTFLLCHAGAQLAYLTHNRTFVASHMAEVDQEVATALFSKTNGFSQSDSSQLDSKRQRKLNRMKAAREALGKEKTNNFMVIKGSKYWI